MAIGTNPGGGTLSGTTTVAAVAGVATFSNLSIDKVGNGYTLTASAAGLTGATSTTLQHHAGRRDKLAFTVQPTNTGAGRLHHAGGSGDGAGRATATPCTGATNSITMAIGTNPGGGTLSGTTTVAAVAGVATFSNLSINNVRHRLHAHRDAAGLTGATSSAFNITAGAATKLAFTVQPTQRRGRREHAPAIQVTVQDALRQHRDQRHELHHPGHRDQPRRRHALRHQPSRGGRPASRRSTTSPSTRRATATR